MYSQLFTQMIRNLTWFCHPLLNESLRHLYFRPNPACRAKNTVPLSHCSQSLGWWFSLNKPSCEEFFLISRMSAPGRLPLYLPLKFRLGVWLLWRYDRPITPRSCVLALSTPSSHSEGSLKAGNSCPSNVSIFGVGWERRAKKKLARMHRAWMQMG